MKRYRLPYENQQHSQHGEDGIIAVMTQAILNPNRFVLEIGWGSGKQNMSRALMEQGWSGIGIDGAREPHPDIKIPTQFEFRHMLVEPGNLEQAFRGVPTDLDFFSLDIDSFDFEVAAWALEHGYRPRTVCLEFNYRFGPQVQASFPWVPRTLGRKKFVYNKHQFHGVSLAKYRALWQKHGYRYFGFDSSGVNVFFYDPEQLQPLDHLLCLTEADLNCQQDQVKPIIESDDYWKQHLNTIYQSVPHA